MGIRFGNFKIPAYRGMAMCPYRNPHNAAHHAPFIVLWPRPRPGSRQFIQQVYPKAGGVIRYDDF